LALILDTRFLIAHTFPPSEDDRLALARFAQRLLREQLYISAISIAEYLKVAGARIGREAALARLRAWARQASVAEVSREDAERAGLLLLSHPSVPVADAIIAAQSARLRAAVVSDDPHYRALGVRTIWYK